MLTKEYQKSTGNAQSLEESVQQMRGKLLECQEAVEKQGEKLKELGLRYCRLENACGIYRKIRPKNDLTVGRLVVRAWSLPLCCFRKETLYFILSIFTKC